MLAANQLPVENRMQPQFVALTITILPLLAVHTAYFMSASADLVPDCIPYLEGCTSISRAARRGDAIFVFRPLMIVSAVLLMMYWRLMQQWLRRIETEPSNQHRIMCWLGFTGALFLILYANFLGTEGDIYRFLRRHGIIVFFSFTPLAQLLLVKQLLRISYDAPDLRIRRAVVFYKLFLCATMLSIGIVSALLDYLGLQTDARENIIEWNFAICMLVYFAGSYILWRDTAFQVGFQVRKA